MSLRMMIKTGNMFGLKLQFSLTIKHISSIFAETTKVVMNHNNLCMHACMLRYALSATSVLRLTINFTFKNWRATN